MVANSSSILCIGELLIDFFCKDAGVHLADGHIFEKQAGGAPANVCAAIVKLGGKAVFAGKVGNDPFGHFLKKTLDDIQVDTSLLIMDNDHPTTMAFVSVKADGERDFVFNRGADAFLTEDELDYSYMMESSILHFGSATALLDNPFQSSYLHVMKLAKEKGKFVSFDPNFRADLWKGRIPHFIELAKQGISMADFIKVSDEELRIISGKDDLEEGIEAFHQLGAQSVAVTLGKEGTMISNGQEAETVPSVKIRSIDSTGAGDAFVGATLYQLAKVQNPSQVLADFQELKRVIYSSNKVGACVCTKIGALSALPNMEEVYSMC
ncbi:carbohydrate kinase [Mesobacillus foraminis]|uniref:carbohydrate kinase family protein n=1 Tax=Mesobacillus foraminis TaxID=279826 RepID=UPI0039A2749F